MAVPSCGLTGVPQTSAETPCQVSNQVSVPKSREKAPSAPNIYRSSNKQARVVMSSSEFEYQLKLSEVSPTAKAPAIGANFQLPSSADAATDGGTTPIYLISSK